MWKQQKAMEIFKYMDLPNDNRHHVLLMQCLHNSSGHAVKYYKDNGDMVRMNKLIDYMLERNISLDMPAHTMQERTSGLS